MRLMKWVIPALAAMVLIVPAAGCGSSPSYADNARSAIKTMAKALHKYDAARPASVAATGAACKSALAALKGRNTLAGQTPPSQYKQLDLALKRAFASARAGFTDCVSGASSFNYVTMVHADTEISDANSWIAEAKRLDH
jgi:hypothetical protein